MGKTLLTFGPMEAGVRLSREEFSTARFEEPYRYERVKGRLAVMSPAGPEHQDVSRPFRKSLGLYWAQHEDLIFDVVHEGWVATSDDDDRIPDICVYFNTAEETKRAPLRVPEMIFEFVSGNRSDQERDYITKREEYHRIGVREYVIVDRFKQQALVLSWNADEYAEQVLSAADDYTSSLMPGLSVSLAAAFAP